MRNLYSIAGAPSCRVRQENEDTTMRSTNRKSQSTARRIWEVFMTGRTYQSRQLLKNRST